MNINNYIQLLNHPNSKVENKELEEIIKIFPYFQSARAIYLKKLYQENSYKYNNALKKTAAYTIDRQILFEYITSENFVQKPIKKSVPQKVTKKKEILEIGKPLQFKSTEKHSFNQWMQLINHKKITEEEKEENNSNHNLIDQFITNNPKIKPILKASANPDISVESTTKNTHLMTETLAKVYVEQKKYDNAIQAYKILSLKYPEKSSFFANHIKEIKRIQKT